MEKLRVFTLLAGLATMGGVGVARAGSPYDAGGEGGTGGYGGDGGAGGYEGSHPDKHHGHAPDCQVVMRDRFNGFSTLLTADGHGYHHDLKFRVTNDDERGEDIWIETARFKDRFAPMQTTAGVPHQSISYIREKYDPLVDAFHEDGVVQVDDQLTYVLMPRAHCSKDEFAMIHFFVMEWFFYG